MNSCSGRAKARVQLLFLLRGKVDVVKDGWHIACITTPGAVFGDMALLRGQPHSANVVAVKESSLYVVNDATSFLLREPLMALHIAAVQSERLDSANRCVIAARNQLLSGEHGTGEVIGLLDEIGAALHRAA